MQIILKNRRKTPPKTLEINVFFCDKNLSKKGFQKARKMQKNKKKEG